MGSSCKGGSARRRIVKYDESSQSYKVTGVPGHTHNASAVCSVLVDNTETTNRPVSIHATWTDRRDALNFPLNADGNRFTDSEFYDDSDYDRAIERGSGASPSCPRTATRRSGSPCGTSSRSGAW